MRRVPHVPGVLTEDQCDKTGAAIAAMQEPTGAMPWFPGGQTDPWDHIESAMALSVTGRHPEAEAAYEWSRRTQRPDGSWAIRTVVGTVADANTDANFCAYLAVGVWHHYLITGDTRFLERLWPTVWSAIELVVRFQAPGGQIRWGGKYPLPTSGVAFDPADGSVFDAAMLTGSASIHQALGCAAAIADEMKQPAPAWRHAQLRLGHALRAHTDRFAPPSDHSMDWYYPVLGGAVRGRAGQELIADRWDEFVVADLGIRCVDHRPWVTGAETCELVLAMNCLGDDADATRLFADMQHLRDPDGSYWTGLVFSDGKRWPVEKSCWTSAAVVLAADALSRTSSANGIFRDADPLVDVTVPASEVPGLSCDCTNA
ncbi:prenyltransferase [Williamsia maris]|uniref:prenyltransferase n=1 Tax=Williamsia maris TaxID=72806 RepID=UPI0020A5E4AE|nr:prenyltransferase [Williamsia maris]